MRSWKRMSIGLKLSIGTTVILALSVVGVLAAERFDGANQDAVQARQTGADSDTENSDDAKPTGKPLELGTVAKISSNYRVAVTEISQYKVPAGRLIVASLDAAYIGKQDGEPWADLMVEFSGSGSKTFDESGCPFDLGDEDPADQTTLGAGDKATYAVCIDLPNIDIKGGRVSVEEAFSSTGKRISWSTKEAVTKELPSAAPASPNAPAPRSQPHRQPANDVRSDDVCDDFDDDEYQQQKEYGEYLEDQYQAKKDTMDDDDIDDYKDWKKKHDRMMDYYEKWHEECG
jgi:hypothetical protein